MEIFSMRKMRERLIAIYCHLFGKTRSIIAHKGNYIDLFHIITQFEGIRQNISAKT